MASEAEMNDEIGIALNSLARGQMRARLLADIALDLMVCELEGLDPSAYIKELREMIADIEAQIDAATAKWGQE